MRAPAQLSATPCLITDHQRHRSNALRAVSSAPGVEEFEWVLQTGGGKYIWLGVVKTIVATFHQRKRADPTALGHSSAEMSDHHVFSVPS